MIHMWWLKRKGVAMKRLACFFLLVYLFTWTFWGLSLLESTDIIVLPFPREYFGIVGGFGPSVMGLYFLIRYRKRSFKSIIGETFKLKTDGKNIFVIFALMPSILGMSYLITRFVFGIEYTLEWFNQPAFIPIVFLYILFLGGPLGEEIGWRGYALPKLMKRYSPFIASLILGLVWAFWHLPAFFIAGSSQEGISFPLYIINTIVLTLIITILYLRTKQISSALYFHTSANFALGIFYIIDEPMALLFIGIGMVGSLGYLLYRERETMFSRRTM